MIRKEDALDDLNKINVTESVGKVVVEVGKVLVKMLATIRSNQLLTDEEKVKIRAAKKAKEVGETSK